MSADADAVREIVREELTELLNDIDDERIVELAAAVSDEETDESGLLDRMTRRNVLKTAGAGLGGGLLGSQTGSAAGESFADASGSVGLDSQPVKEINSKRGHFQSVESSALDTEVENGKRFVVSPSTDIGFDDLSTAIDSAPLGGEVVLTEDVTVSSNIYLRKAQTLVGFNPTDRGDSPTITLNGDVALKIDGRDKGPHSTIGIGGTVRNVTFDGVDKTPTRGILLGKQAAKVKLDSVAVKNCQRGVEFDGAFQNLLWRVSLNNNNYGAYVHNTVSTVTGQITIAGFSSLSFSDTAGLFVGSANEVMVRDSHITSNAKGAVIEGPDADSCGFDRSHFEANDNHAIETDDIDVLYIGGGTTFVDNGTTDGVAAISFNPSSGNRTGNVTFAGVKEGLSGAEFVEAPGSGTVRDLLDLGIVQQSGFTTAAGVSFSKPLGYNQLSGEYDESEKVTLRNNLNIRGSSAQLNFSNGGFLNMNGQTIRDPPNTVSNDSMTADPESTSEDGFIEVDLNGSVFQIPVYSS